MGDDEEGKDVIDGQYELDFGADYGSREDGSEGGSPDEYLDMKDAVAVAQRLTDIVDELACAVSMEDWTIRLKYAPNPDNVNIADVSCTVHKEADITFYQYRPDMVYDDVLHELMHCKVFLIRNSYAKVVEGFGEMLGNLVTEYEELVVDDLARMAKRYVVGEDEGGDDDQ